MTVHCFRCGEPFEVAAEVVGELAPEEILCLACEDWDDPEEDDDRFDEWDNPEGWDDEDEEDD